MSSWDATGDYTEQLGSLLESVERLRELPATVHFTEEDVSIAPCETAFLPIVWSRPPVEKLNYIEGVSGSPVKVSPGVATAEDAEFLLRVV